jgi:hypothetical protein
MIGRFHLDSYSSSIQTYIVQLLVIGGGGSGMGRTYDASSGDGGSAGQLIYLTSHSINTGVYQVIVGNGGEKKIGWYSNGNASSINNIVATGGTGGQSRSSVNATSGGNGAGGPGEGPYTNWNNGHSGNGGPGLQIPLFSNKYFCGGGGGGAVTYLGTPGAGGVVNAGGRGQYWGFANSKDGITPGSGGGGDSNYGPYNEDSPSLGYGGSGANGIVCIAYPTNSVSAIGGTVTYNEGYTIHTFTESGTFIIN